MTLAKCSKLTDKEKLDKIQALISKWNDREVSEFMTLVHIEEVLEGEDGEAKR